MNRVPTVARSCKTGVATESLSGPARVFTRADLLSFRRST